MLAALLSWSAAAAADEASDAAQRTAQERSEKLAERDRLWREATALDRGGQLQDALRQAKTVLALEREVYGDLNQRVVTTLEWIAARQEQTEDLQDAEDARGELVELQSRLLGEGHWKVADAKAALTHVRRLRQLTAEQREELADAQEMDRRADALFNKKKYRESAKLREKTLAVRRESLGSDHRLCALDLNRLGVLHGWLGDQARAEQLYRDALEICLQVLGERHPDTAQTLSNIGFVSNLREDYAESAVFYRRALNSLAETLGAEHQRHAAVRGQLVAALEKLAAEQEEREQYRAASETWADLLAFKVEDHGTSHWKVTDTRLSLARATRLDELDEDGRATWLEAKSLGEEAARLYRNNQFRQAIAPRDKRLAIFRELFGEEHPLCADELNKLGVLQSRIGDDPGRTETLYRESLAVSLQVFGEQHPTTANVLDNLGVALENSQKYEQSASYYRRAAEARAEALGNKSDEYLSSRRSLARVLASLAEQLEQTEDFAGARKHRQEVIDIQRAAYGENHWQVADARLALESLNRRSRLTPDERVQLAAARQLDVQADEQFRQKNFRQAATLREQALAIRAAVLGEQDPDFAENLNRMGVAYSRMEQYARAEFLQRSALQSYLRLFGQEHPDVALLFNNLGYVYDQLGDYEASASHYRQAMTIRQSLFGRQHREYRESRDALAGVLERLAGKLEQRDDYASARAAWDEVLPIRIARDGEEHWSVTDARLERDRIEQLAGLSPEARDQLSAADLLYQQAVQLRAQGSDEQAIEAAQQSAEMVKRVLGENSLDHEKRISYVAESRFALRQYRQSLPFYEEALAISRQLLGPHHPRLALALNNRGAAHSWLGEYAEAIADYREAIDNYDGSVEATHVGRRKTVENLALALEAQARELAAEDDLDAALAAREEIISLWRELQGESHWRVRGAQVALQGFRQEAALSAEQRAQLRLAERWQEQAWEHDARLQFDEALRLVRQALETWQAILGPQSLKSADALVFLGDLLDVSGQQSEALRPYQQALAIRSDVLGPEHPQTAELLNRLGYLLGAMQDYPAAQRYFAQALAIQEKVLGAEHGDTRSTRDGLNQASRLIGSLESTRMYSWKQGDLLGRGFVERARQLDREGRLAEARAAAGQAVLVARKLFGVQSEAAANRLAELGDMHVVGEDSAAARSAYQESLAIRTRLYGEDDWRVADLRASLATTDRLAVLDEDQLQRWQEARRLLERTATLNEQGDYGEAIPLVRQALEERTELLGSERLPVADCAAWLASLHFRLAEFESSRNYRQQEVAIREKVLGVDHPATASALQRLGIVLEETGDYTGARRCYEQALDINTRLMGPGHADTASSQLTLANMLVHTGQPDAARTLYEKALSSFQEQHGPEHEDVANCLNGLASVFQHAGDVSRAREHFERALAIWEKAQGPDHPRVAIVLDNLGSLLRRVGDFAAARQHLQRSLDIRQQTFGAQHPDTAVSLHSLGLLHIDLGDADRGELLIQEAFEIRKAHLPKTHSRYEESVETLAAIYDERAAAKEWSSDFAAAGQLRQQILDLKSDFYGPQHWQVTDARLRWQYVNRLSELEPSARRRLDEAEALLKRAAELIEQEAFDEAASAAEQACQIRRALLGPRHFRTADSLTQLAQVHFQAKQYAEAVRLYQQAMQINKEVRGEAHPEYWASRALIAATHQLSGDYAEAERLLEQGREFVESAFGAENEYHALMLSLLVLAYDAHAAHLESEDDFAAAAELRLKALEAKKRMFGELHWKVHDAQVALARVEQLAALEAPQRDHWLESKRLLGEADRLYDDGKFHEARPLAEQAVQLRRQILGNHHLDTASAISSVVKNCRRLDDLESAKRYAEEELAILSGSLGDQHPRTADSRGALGLILSNMDRLEESRAQLEQALAVYERLDPHAFGASVVLNNLALACGDLGDWRAARQHLDRALQIRERTHGPEHPRTANVIHNLAELSFEQGDYQAARASYDRVLAIRRKALGEDHPETVRSWINSCLALQKLGESAAARERLNQALAICEQAFGQHHVLTAHVLRQLGNLHTDLEDYQAAQGYLEQSISICETVFGREHQETAIALNHLGRAYYEEGDFEAARAHFEQALDIQRRVQGPDHTATVRAARAVGLAYQAMGQYEQARSRYEQALENATQRWGDDHPSTAEALRYHGDKLNEMGFYEEARQHYERALEIRKSTFGYEHRATAVSLDDLAHFYLLREDYTKARHYMEQALSVYRRALDANNPYLATTLHNVGIAYLLMGSDQESIRYLEEALAMGQQLLGPMHPGITATLSGLALAVEKYDPERARQLREQELTIHRNVVQTQDPVTAESLLHLADKLKDRERYEEALPYYQRALDIRRSQFGQEHSRTVFALESLGKLYAAMKQHAAARPYYEQALSITQKTKGPGDSASAYYLKELGKLLLETGQIDEAKEYLESALETYRTQFGGEHATTAARLSELGRALVNQDDETARRYLEEALAIRIRTRGPEDVNTSEAYLALADGLIRAGHDRDAWPYAVRGLAGRARATQQGLAVSAETEHHRIAGYRGRALFEAVLNLADALGTLDDRQADELLSAIFDWKGISNQTVLARQEALVLERDPEAAELFDQLKAVRRQFVSAEMHAASRTGEGVQRANREELQHTQSALERQLSQRVEEYALLRQRFEAGPELVAERLERDAVLVEFVKYDRNDLVAGDRPWGPSRYAAVLLWPSATKGWLTDLSAAEFESQRYGRPMLIHFHADWAAPSLQMQTSVLNSPEVRQALRGRVVTVRLEQRANEKAWARFGVAAVPTVLFVAADGQVQGKLVGAKNKADFLAWLDPYLQEHAVGQPPRWIALGDAQPIEDAVRQWRQAVQGGLIDPDVERRLRELVWDPLADVLPRNVTRLYVAPDGQLSLIPFEAIRLQDSSYLIENFQVSYLSNGRDLMPRMKSLGDLGPATVLSDPDYEAFGDASGPMEPAVLADSSSGMEQRSSDIATRGLFFQSLPGFAGEASAVAGAWQQARPETPIEVLHGGAASEENLSALRRPRILHFITHGFFLPDLRLATGIRTGLEMPAAGEQPPLPTVSALDNGGRGQEPIDLKPEETRPQVLQEDPRLRSGLALAGANQWLRRIGRGQSDGLLTALEVQDLDLWGTELVVLSACETGLGEVQVGEGVLGLRRAFQQAGAETVVASLWKVPDAETQRLMARFFQLWLSGDPKSEALRRAQLELIDQLRRAPDSSRGPAAPLYWAGFICHGDPR